MRPKILVICTAILAAFLFSGCNKKTVIGLLMDSYETERWERDKDLFTSHVSELGGEVITDVANGDAAVQFEQARKMLEEWH